MLGGENGETMPFLRLYEGAWGLQCCPDGGQGTSGESTDLGMNRAGSVAPGQVSPLCTCFSMDSTTGGK